MSFSRKIKFRGAYKILSNFYRLARLIPIILRDGGYRSVNVAQIQYGSMLSGKRILITGGSSGIGLSIARKAIDLGAKVLITGRDSLKLEKASFDLNNPNLRTLVWDVADMTKLKFRLAEVLEIFGGDFDILVNNAGVLSEKTFPSVTEEDWDRVYGINSKGLYFLTQEVCRFWLGAKDTSKIRKIINISSQGGFVGATYPYRMSKWDIAGLTQGLGISLASKNIIVNGIAPGIIATDMQKNYLRQGDNVFCDLNPLNRVAYPFEIAELAAFLLSDASNFIVAQTIVCDGGFSVK